MKVLLATDGSDCSQLAESALNLTPRLREAPVIVATVVPSMHIALAGIQPYGMAVGAEQAREAMKAGHSHARALVDESVSRLRAGGRKADGFVLEGNICDELLKLAESERIDLVVVGSRGLGAIKSFVLGSVARKMVTHARASVLAVHPFKNQTLKESRSRLDTLRKARVVIAVDGSDGAQAVERWLREEPDGAFESLTAVCAEPLSVVPAGVDPGAFLPFYEYDRERVQAIVKLSAERLAGLAGEVSATTDVGRPVDVVTDAAEKAGADLLAVGATRHGAFERFLIGSVSYEVAVKSPCSVLVVRPPLE